MKVWIYVTFGEYETLKGKRYTFHQNQVSGFIQDAKQMVLHLSPLTIHQFFSHLKKEMVLFVEEDYGSLISLWSQIVSILKVSKKNLWNFMFIR